MRELGTLVLTNTGINTMKIFILAVVVMAIYASSQDGIKYWPNNNVDYNKPQQRPVYNDDGTLADDGFNNFFKNITDPHYPDTCFKDKDGVLCDR